MAYKYHILKATVPNETLTANGYPEKLNISQGGTWVIFDGTKDTALESAFDDYLPDTPYPAYWGGKAVNLTQAEACAIACSYHASDENSGWHNQVE